MCESRMLHLYYHLVANSFGFFCAASCRPPSSLTSGTRSLLLLLVAILRLGLQPVCGLSAGKPCISILQKNRGCFRCLCFPQDLLILSQFRGESSWNFFCLFINFLYSIFSENSSCRIELLYPYISGKMSSPQQRLSSIANQLSGPGSAAAKQQILSKNPDDIVSIFAHDAMKLASDANACQ